MRLHNNMRWSKSKQKPRHHFPSWLGWILLLLMVVVVHLVSLNVVSREIASLSDDAASTTGQKRSFHHYLTTTPSLLLGVSSSSHAVHGAPSSVRFEIVTTMLHDNLGQNIKFKGNNENADWLQLPEVQDIPVTICSADRLQATTTTTTSTITEVSDKERTNDTTHTFSYFRPESDHVFGHLLNSSKRVGKITFLPMVNGNLASEVPGYLTFILHHWDSLPDVTIFLHAHPTAHNVDIFQHIRYIIDHRHRQWTLSHIGFLHLNDDRMLCHATKGGLLIGDTWIEQWQMLGFDPNYFPGRIKVPCCAQFMVTKERIHLRTKWFYQQALKLAYELQDANFFEHMWHIIWGEAAILSEDRELRTYVHSNWTNKKPVRFDNNNNHDKAGAGGGAVVLQRHSRPYPNVPCSESMMPWCQMAMKDPGSYYPIVNESRSMCPPGNKYNYEVIVLV